MSLSLQSPIQLAEEGIEIGRENPSIVYELLAMAVAYSHALPVHHFVMTENHDTIH